MKLILIILLILLCIDFYYAFIYNGRIDKNVLATYLDRLYTLYENKFEAYKSSNTFEAYKSSNTFGVDCVYCIVMPNRKDYMIQKMNEHSKIKNTQLNEHMHTNPKKTLIIKLKK
jgi:hypothetical protein